VTGVFAQEAGQQMLERLKWVNWEPGVILEAGCGKFAGQLQALYPAADVIALGVDYPMLEYRQRQDFVNCTQTFADASVDLVFANLVLPWSCDGKKLIAEWRRILRPEGLLVFTSLGPDTLGLLQNICPEQFLPHLLDMHDLGDELVREKFIDPILDLEYVTLNYRNTSQFLRECQALGILARGDYSECSEHASLKASFETVIPAVFEVIHGHAWRAGELAEQTADEFGIVRIPLAHLRRRR
jgi:malonyl-CoA O-methyltransferase